MIIMAHNSKQNKNANNDYKNELTTVPLKKGAYEKPPRTNCNIPAKKYDKVDDACEAAQIGNDGNIYIPEEKMPALLGKNKPESRYIVDNRIPDKDKVTINNQEMVESSGIVGYLEKNSHQTRDADEADFDRYSRDSLIRIGESDQAEAIRRKIDTKVNKELPTLKNKRGSDIDEITGEPLRPGAAFHHKNNKAIENNPHDVINPKKGINVNLETHKEIHRRKIMDEKQLESQKEDIKKSVMRNRKVT